MLQIHNTSTAIQPDQPTQTVEIIEQNQPITVPGQLWMASQLAKLNGETDHQETEQEIIIKQPQTQARQQYKKQPPKSVPQSDAIRARGYVAKQIFENQTKDQPKSQVFKTYGREFNPRQHDVGTSELGPTPNFRLVEDSPPKLVLEENLAQTGTGNRFKALEKENINVQSYNQIIDKTLMHKSMQKVKPGMSPSFKSPERNSVAPNIYKLQYSEEANLQYGTPNGTSPRRQSVQNSRKDEHQYVINQQQAAELCKTTLGRNTTVLKGKIYQQKQPVKTSTDNKNWYLDENATEVLNTYNKKRKQMQQAADRAVKRVVDYDDPEEYVDHQRIRQKLVTQVEKDRITRERVASPWKQWKMPENQISNNNQENKNKYLDAAKQANKEKIIDAAKQKIIKNQINNYYEKEDQENKFTQKKNPYNVNYNSPTREKQQKPPFSMAKTDKFDLLQENKYLNEGVQRPLDRKLIAQMRNQKSYNQTSYDLQKCDKIKANQQKIAEKPKTAFSAQRTVSPQQRSTPARPTTSPFKNQYGRGSVPRSRGFIDQNQNQNFFAVADKELENAEILKFQFANELTGMIKDNKGQNLTVLANQMLMEQMGARLKMVKNEQQVIVQHSQPDIKSVNDLKPNNNKINYNFSSQRPRETIQQKAQSTQLSKQKIDQMAVILNQGGDLENFRFEQPLKAYKPAEFVPVSDQIDTQKAQFYALSQNQNQMTANLNQAGRGVLHGKIALEGNKFPDYDNFIDSNAIYAKLNSKKVLVKDLGVQDRNDHSRVCAEAQNESLDRIYNPKLQTTKNDIIGFDKQSRRDGGKIQCNDLAYDVNYGLTEKSVLGMVDLGRQSGRFK